MTVSEKPQGPYPSFSITIAGLRIFESVARHANFARAAEELPLSQPYVPNQIHESLQPHAAMFAPCRQCPPAKLRRVVEDYGFRDDRHYPTRSHRRAQGTSWKTEIWDVPLDISLYAAISLPKPYMAGSGETQALLETLENIGLRAIVLPPHSTNLGR